MKHDVFISFSSVNMDVARKICEALEETGEVKCWIAYRDIVPSANYAEQLVEAIESCKLVLLVLSEDSNKSPQVAREIERAGSKGIPILPLRIEDVALSKSMEYFISSHHWLDAFDTEIESCFPALREAVSASIRGKGTQPEPGIDTKTRTRPRPRGISPRVLFGGAVVITVLAFAFFFLRPESKAPQPAATAPVSAGSTPPSAATALSPQDALIQDLARRFRENKEPVPTETDGWTSNVLTVAFLDISGFGLNGAQRDFILNRTAEELRRNGRFGVVERQVIDKLLAELNLSSSALADPATALKLGRVLSANLIATGSMSRQDGQWLVSLRFIDTETTAVQSSVSVLVNKGGAEEVAGKLSRAVARELRETFPLQARIAGVSESAATINIGRSVGVREGMVFALLGRGDTVIGQVTVTSVEPEQSAVSSVGDGVAVDTRLREKVRE